MYEKKLKCQRNRYIILYSLTRSLKLCQLERFAYTEISLVIVQSRDMIPQIVSFLVDVKVPYLTFSDAVCKQKNGKIALVIMAGEQGTHIRDNIPATTLLRENQNRHHLAITLYENTIYRIRIQLDCFAHYKGGLPDGDCNVAQDVNVLIDFNNDERFDEAESRVPHRWPLPNSMSLGVYDLELNIPAIDRVNTKLGPHRMRIVIMPSEEYRRICGNTDYREVREYTVNIIPKAAYRGKIAPLASVLLKCFYYGEKRANSYSV